MKINCHNFDCAMNKVCRKFIRYKNNPKLYSEKFNPENNVKTKFKCKSFIND